MRPSPDLVRNVRKSEDLAQNPDIPERAHETEKPVELSFSAQGEAEPERSLRARKQDCQETRCLTPAQRRFLTLFDGADPVRLRTCWLDEQGRSLGPVVDTDNPPPGALQVKAWRLVGHDGHDFVGAMESKRRLPVADLAALAGLWDVPLRSLNEIGLDLARTATDALTTSFRMTGSATPVQFRQTPSAFAALKARAQAEGRTMSAILNDALAEYLERHG